MPPRFFALLLLVALTGCQWEGRPDGAEANHSNEDGYTDDILGTPMGTEAEVVEPLGGVPTPGAAPVDLTQPAPTTGTADATSEVEEALTPGTER